MIELCRNTGAGSGNEGGMPQPRHVLGFAAGVVAALGVVALSGSPSTALALVVPSVPPVPPVPPVPMVGGSPAGGIEDASARMTTTLSRAPVVSEDVAAEHAAMLDKRRRIREALAAAPEPRPPCGDDCQGALKLQLRLVGAVADCRDLLDDDATGTARFEATIVAAPEIGAVVDDVRVREDPIGNPAFTECIVQSALAAELAEPAQAVSERFAFRYSAGPRPDNAVDFLDAHPEVVQAHPQLQAALEHAAAGTSTSADATAFATAISTDEAAAQAFVTWSRDQGIDLAGARDPDEP